MKKDWKIDYFVIDNWNLLKIDVRMISWFVNVLFCYKHISWPFLLGLSLFWFSLSLFLTEYLARFESRFWTCSGSKTRTITWQQAMLKIRFSDCDLCTVLVAVSFPHVPCLHLPISKLYTDRAGTVTTPMIYLCNFTRSRLMDSNPHAFLSFFSSNIFY